MNLEKTGTNPRLLRAGNKGKLCRLRAKLLFILMYFKLYPLQEVMGLLLGLHPSEASRWVHRRTPVLEKALGRRLELPSRRPADLQRVLAECPSLEWGLDGGGNARCAAPRTSRGKSATTAGKRSGPASRTWSSPAVVKSRAGAGRFPAACRTKGWPIQPAGAFLLGAKLPPVVS